MEARKYSIEVESFNDEGEDENASSSFYTEQQLDFSTSARISTDKKTSIKNLIIISVCYAMFFTGMAALCNLQSTMNFRQNSGVKSQAIIYFFSMVSSLFLPKIVIRRLGCKRTITLMFTISCLYIVANFYPTEPTLYSAATFYGLTTGPQGTAQNLYVMEMASRYAAQVLDTTQHTSAKFYGIFTFFAANTQIWGNVISYLVLGHNTSHVVNVTDQAPVLCGIDFNNSYVYQNDSANNNPNLEPPSDEKRYILVGIYTALGLVSALFVAIWLDPLNNDMDDSGQNRKSAVAHVFSALNNMKTFNQLSLLPITIFAGLELAFYQADFTQAFIACYWGVYNVGFVMIVLGVSGALTALIVGPLVKRCGQMPALTTAALLNAISCLLMLLWDTALQGRVVLFGIAALWGAADAIWWSQIPALYSDIFSKDKEAGFSNFWFWSFFGSFASFSYAGHLSTTVKVYILLGTLIGGLGGCALLFYKKPSYQRLN